MKVALAILNDPTDAEDALSQAAAEMEAKDDYDDKDAEKVFKGYVRNTARRANRKRARDSLRNQKHGPVLVASELSNDPLDGVLYAEQFEHLDSRIAELPERQRRVVTLSLQGYSQEEIAIKMETTVHAVKGLKKRAMQTLRMQMLAYAA